MSIAAVEPDLIDVIAQRLRANRQLQCVLWVADVDEQKALLNALYASRYVLTSIYSSTCEISQYRLSIYHPSYNPVDISQIWVLILSVQQLHRLAQTNFIYNAFSWVEYNEHTTLHVWNQLAEPLKVSIASKTTGVDLSRLELTELRKLVDQLRLEIEEKDKTIVHQQHEIDQLYQPGGKGAQTAHTSFLSSVDAESDVL